MAVTPTNIIAAFPEFDAADLTTFVSMAEDRLTAGQWGNAARYYQAVAFLAMHMATKAGLSAYQATGASGAGGPVTAQSAGKVSKSYGKPTVTAHYSADEDLASTKFGLMFLQLRASNANSSPSLLAPGVNITVAQSESEEALD